MTKLVQNVLTSVDNLCQHMDILLLENKKISSNDDADMLPYVIRACTTLQDKLRLYRLRTTQITSLPLNSKQEKNQIKRPQLQLLPRDILHSIFSWCDATALTVARKSCKSFSYTHFSTSLPLVDAVAKSICKSQYRFSEINTLSPRSWESWTQILGMLELQRSCIKRSTRIAFEGNYSFFILRNGEVYRDYFGEIDYFFEPRSYVTKIHITQVATGNIFRLLLSDKGIVYSAGYNFNGQLGNGQIGRPDVLDDYTHHPEEVLIPDKISYIGAGDEHSICITTDGEIWTFGKSECGQCGHGDRNDTSLPIKVEMADEQNPPPFFVQCSGGYSQSYFLTNDGRVFGCGLNISKNAQYATRPTEMNTNGIQNRVVQVLAVRSRLYYLTLEGLVYYSVHDDSSKKNAVPKFLTKSETNFKVIQFFAGYYSLRFLLSDGSLTRYSREDEGETDGRLILEQKCETVEGMSVFTYSGKAVSYIIESTQKEEFLRRIIYNVDGSLLFEQQPLKLSTI